MKERVTVIKTEGNQAVVRLEKKEACAKCGMCLFPKNATCSETRAENTLGAVAGDEVLIERKKDLRLLGIMLIFGIPLLLILLCVFIGGKYIENEIWILFLCLAVLLSWYTIIAIIDKKLQKISSFSWVIVEISQKGEDNNGNTGDNGSKGVLPRD